MANKANIEKIKKVISENYEKLSYINLKMENGKCSYGGWISNFNIYKLTDKEHRYPIYLDLNNENDLFMLFSLASCWSRSGQFENATYFIIYLKEKKLDNPEIWLDDAFVDEQRENRKNSVEEILNLYEDIRLPGRKAISFRKDFYDGVSVLAKNWDSIMASLLRSEERNNYSIFINVIRNIGGIGGKGPDGRMSIKIPLILRELRIANRFKNIPGKWCCVPDTRVAIACNNPFFEIYLPEAMDFGTVLKKSEIIYSLFGDLYDIPLFAYQDLVELGLIK